MDKKSYILDTLSKAAPKIAASLMGFPAIELIGVIGDIIFGDKSDKQKPKTLDEIYDAVCKKGLTEQQLKTLQVRELEAENKALQISLDSQREILQLKENKNVFAKLIAFSIVIGVAAMLVCFFVFKVAEERWFIQEILQNILGPALLCVAVHYFGIPPLSSQLKRWRIFK